MANYCWVYGVSHFTSPAGWLPVYRDQLRAQRSVTSMGKLYLYLTAGKQQTPSPCRRRQCSKPPATLLVGNAFRWGLVVSYTPPGWGTGERSLTLVVELKTFALSEMTTLGRLQTTNTTNIVRTLTGTTPVQQPFVQDYPGEPVPER